MKKKLCIACKKYKAEKEFKQEGSKIWGIRCSQCREERRYG